MIDSLRPSSRTPKYPFYHDGHYLEEYFFYHRKKSNLTRTYIDVFWTNIYSNRSFAGVSGLNVQSELDKLDPKGSYFTLCQNDDGVLEKLPPDTLKFCAGGNRVDGMTIPIPLLASPIPNIDLTKEKDILASFVGSNTHPLRADMYKSLRKKDGFSIHMKNWSIELPMNAYDQFMELSSRSKFMLAPRGYGATSFRLYEAFQFNCVPVYITDVLYLPYQELLNWDDISITIQPHEVEHIEDVLLDCIKSGEYDKKLENIKNKKHLFTMEFMVNYIENKLTQ
jgi:hypothetical protein